MNGWSSRESCRDGSASVGASFVLWRTRSELGSVRRRARLQGVGRGATEPDIKQKLGQARGARRGRQERACGIEPCVGTNLTCTHRPPPPHLRSYLLTHALLSIPTPPPLAPLFSLPLCSAALCPHCRAPRPDGGKRASPACFLLGSDRQEFRSLSFRAGGVFPSTLGTTGGAP